MNYFSSKKEPASKVEAGRAKSGELPCGLGHKRQKVAQAGGNFIRLNGAFKTPKLNALIEKGLHPNRRQVQTAPIVLIVAFRACVIRPEPRLEKPKRSGRFHFANFLHGAMVAHVNEVLNLVRAHAQGLQMLFFFFVPKAYNILNIGHAEDV